MKKCQYISRNIQATRFSAIKMLRMMSLFRKRLGHCSVRSLSVANFNCSDLDVRFKRLRAFKCRRVRVKCSMSEKICLLLLERWFTYFADVPLVLRKTRLFDDLFKMFSITCHWVGHTRHQKLGKFHGINSWNLGNNAMLGTNIAPPKLLGKMRVLFHVGHEMTSQWTLGKWLE